MHFPTLTPRARYQQTVDSFGGYNHHLRIGENEFYDMENCASDLWPVVSPRKMRGLYAENVSVQGMIAKDSLCYVEGRNFVINGYAVDLGLSTEEADCPKQLVSMGAYVIILPDKVYFNTADFSDYGPIEAEFTASGMVHLKPCRLDGTEYTPDYIQPEAPKEPTNMQLWMDTSRDPHSLRQYSSAMGTWAAVDTTYLKIQYSGIGKAFRQYDGVTISGLETDENLQLRSVAGDKILYGVEDDAVIIAGLLDVPVILMNIPITLSRKMPKMDFVIEHDNRLWGCRYGLNNDGDVVNELYACALGDFRNWNRFLGVSTDSYFVSLGSDGPFTGAITQGGHPLFFKENCLHKVYGQIPANFQVQTTACRGVQKGCERSLAIVNEILFYKARHAVCSYDGSLPVEASAALGEERYEYAVAAAAIVGEKAPALWSEIAEGLFFAKMANGVTSEHVGYDGADIKQADVNLLAFPHKLITDKEQMMRDLDYYSKKVPQVRTPAMTQSMFSVICSRCGDREQAWRWFLDSYRPNALPPFGVLAEFKGGTNPYFATGAGGTLQSVLFGFAGLDFNPKGGIMQVKNHALPPHWKRLTIKGVGPDKRSYIIENK